MEILCCPGRFPLVGFGVKRTTALLVTASADGTAKTWTVPPPASATSSSGAAAATLKPTSTFKSHTAGLADVTWVGFAFGARCCTHLY